MKELQLVTDWQFLQKNFFVKLIFFNICCHSVFFLLPPSEGTLNTVYCVFLQTGSQEKTPATCTYTVL